MRILLVNSAPLEGSGSSTTTDELGRALVRAGHDVRCLLAAGRAEIKAPFRVRAVLCAADRADADLPFDFPAWTWHPASRNTYADLSDDQFDRYRDTMRRELDRQVSEFDPQVIHCQHTGPLAHLALETGVPYVLTAHAASLRTTSEDPRLQPLAEQAAENAAAVIASSEHLAAAVRRTFDGVDVRLEVVRPELARDVFDPDEPLASGNMPAGLGFLVREGPLVVFAGTLVPRHGAATLVNAAAICESSHPTLRTIVIGGGPQADELRLQAERLELRRTHFLCVQPRSVCRALFAEAKLVVVPSHEAPSTWTLLEALAAGTCVVATTGDGREEILSRETGALVPPDDHELLADAILRGVAEDWKSKQGPWLALRAAQRGDSTRWMIETLALYERALRERGTCA
jgi:glycosyltransferase involved in cell wall biosynthesis